MAHLVSEPYVNLAFVSCLNHPHHPRPYHFLSRQPTGYFRHIVHVDIDNNRVLPLTHGAYEVNRLLHWDQVDNWM